MMKLQEIRLPVTMGRNLYTMASKISRQIDLLLSSLLLSFFFKPTPNRISIGACSMAGLQ